MHIVLCDVTSPIQREGLFTRFWATADRRAKRVGRSGQTEWIFNGIMSRLEARALCWHGVTLFWGFYKARIRVLHELTDFVPQPGHSFHGNLSYTEVHLPSGGVWLGSCGRLGESSVRPCLQVEPGRYRLTTLEFEEPVERWNLQDASELPDDAPPDWEFVMVRLPEYRVR